MEKICFCRLYSGGGGMLFLLVPISAATCIHQWDCVQLCLSECECVCVWCISIDRLLLSGFLPGSQRQVKLSFLLHFVCQLWTVCVCVCVCECQLHDKSPVERQQHRHRHRHRHHRTGTSTTTTTTVFLTLPFACKLINAKNRSIDYTAGYTRKICTT